jgi:hypothetical protein
MTGGSEARAAELTLDSHVRLRAAVLGRSGEEISDETIETARAELGYVARSQDLVGLVRSWIDSDEFVYRWPQNPTFERVQGTHRWSGVDAEPPPLIHLHVPKTAGTSLNARLLEHFDPVDVCVQQPLRSFLSLPLARLMSLRLITGHYGRLAVDLVRHRDPIVFSMVRDPFEYYPSLWRYLRKVEGLDPELSLHDWLAKRAVTDRQCKALAFDPRDAPGFSATDEGLIRIVDDAPLDDQVQAVLDSLTLVAPSEHVAELYAGICEVAGLERLGETVDAFPRLNTTEVQPIGELERELIATKSPLDRWLYEEVVRRWAARSRGSSPATPTDRPGGGPSPTQDGLTSGPAPS